MRLAFVYVPVTDLKKALAHYRDQLGFAEAWREGQDTAALRMPGTDVELMLDQGAGPKDRPGPFFLVDSVADYRSARPDLAWRGEPEAIPGGWVSSFAGPSGNVTYVADQSDQPGAGEPAAS